MVNTIRTLFANMMNSNSLKEIDLGSTKYKAFAYKAQEEYGVCFPVDNSLKINEKFNIAIYKTSYLKMGDKSMNMLMLGCKNESFRNEFATICADFIKLGENDSAREEVLENPYIWFEKWKNLIGNKKTSLMVYDIMGEMHSLLYLFSIGEKPIWNSMNMGTHDIECSNSSYEVKSSIKKMSKVVNISSPHQLEKDNGKDLFLLYCQFEESELGESIEDLRKQLIYYGMDAAELSSYLLERGYVEGKAEYSKKYILRDMSQYCVDDDFPKLTFKDFIDGKLPKGVLYYTYTIELSDVNCVKLK